MPKKNIKTKKILQPKQDIIIHLPINPDDFTKYENEKFTLKYNPNINDEPISFSEVNDNQYSFFSNKKKDIVEDEPSIKKRTKQLENDIMDKITKNNSYQTNILKDYQNLNKEKRRPNETNIHCWWDCHEFSGTPIGIPYDYKGGVYYIYGNFCGPECAAAHLFKENLPNTEKYKRFEMLHDYYNKLTDNNNIENRIELAPDKIIMKIFGGILDIKQYRKLLKNNTKKVSVLTPPIISITPTLETENKNRIFTNKNHIFIPLDDNKVQTAKDNLIIKRSKPIRNNSNMLFKTMNIKYKSRNN